MSWLVIHFGIEVCSEFISSMQVRFKALECRKNRILVYIGKQMNCGTTLDVIVDRVKLGQRPRKPEKWETTADKSKKTKVR